MRRTGEGGNPGSQDGCGQAQPANGQLRRLGLCRIKRLSPRRIAPLPPQVWDPEVLLEAIGYAGRERRVKAYRVWEGKVMLPMAECQVDTVLGISQPAILLN